jgi:hypothetical protein
MSMIGKWVTIPEAEADIESVGGYFSDGQITDEIGTDFFLVRLRNVQTATATDGPSHSRIFSIADLADGFFFENETELDRFREWATEDPAKILKFER